MSQRPGTPFDDPNKPLRDFRDAVFGRPGPGPTTPQPGTGPLRRSGGIIGDMFRPNTTGPQTGTRPLPDTLDNAAAAGKATGEAIGKGVRMAGNALRTAFGGGAITGESADRRSPTEQTIIGNPMAHPMAADSVKMPQDLQAGYMHMNRFGSPLPIHGLGTPARTSMANMMQDQNFMAYHKAIIGNRNPMGMSRIPFGAIA